MADPGGLPVISVEELDAADDRRMADFYRRILVPHFRPEELDSPETFTAGLKSGGTRALAARLPDGTLAGGAVGGFFPRSQVVLLSYIAVPPEGRGMGTGSILMKVATEVWEAAWRPLLMVMEVEDPRHYGGDASFGDPRARVRFYERLGARTLPVPYFQPALAAGVERVRNLLLMVFGGTSFQAGAGQVDGAVVESFLIEYLESCEGPVRPDDTEAQCMLAACRRPGGLPSLLGENLEG